MMWSVAGRATQVAAEAFAAVCKRHEAVHVGFAVRAANWSEVLMVDHLYRPAHMPAVAACKTSGVEILLEKHRPLSEASTIERAGLGVMDHLIYLASSKGA